MRIVTAQLARMQEMKKKLARLHKGSLPKDAHVIALKECTRIRNHKYQEYAYHGQTNPPD